MHDQSTSMVRFLSILLLCTAFCITGSAAADEETIDEAIVWAERSSTDAQMHQKDNTILTEYDMRFTPEQWEAVKEARSGKGRKKRNALRNLQSRWENAVMPYTVAGGFSDEDMVQIRSGINGWNRFSCVNIRPATSSDQYSVNVVSTGGCTSMVGTTRRKGQTLTLGPGCRYKGVVAHEFGHALGFYHEQTRPDRDQYIRIIKENIDSTKLFNFQKSDWNLLNSYDVPYDYESIMHYGKTAFSTNGQTTIQTLDPKFQNVIGNQYGISFSDIQLINLMYNCNSKCPKKSCSGGGFVGKDCKCWCKGPDIKQPAVYCDTRKAVGGGNSIGTTPTRPPSSGNRDNHPNCPYWASRGECKKNPRYMLLNCKKSCGF